MEDDEVIERLTEVRGIGRWTAEMFLIFRLGRPDVLPVGDYGVRKGFAVVFRKRALPTREAARTARQSVETLPNRRELVPLACRRARQPLASLGIDPLTRPRRCRSSAPRADSARDASATTLIQRGPISVIDYRCSVAPEDKPFVERHEGFSLSYVRKGSFGYRRRGRSFELVAGSLLVGYPGEEFVCTHDTVHGDECLSFHLSPALVEAVGGCPEVWRVGCMPPLPQLMVLGELGEAAVRRLERRRARRSWLLFAARFVEVARGRTRARPQATAATAAAPSKRRYGSMRIRTKRSTSMKCGTEVGLSSFHFLRMFASVRRRDPASVPRSVSPAPCRGPARRRRLVRSPTWRSMSASQIFPTSCARFIALPGSRRERSAAPRAATERSFGIDCASALCSARALVK